MNITINTIINTHVS